METNLQSTDTLSIADLRCPTCGHADSFVIHAGVSYLMHADGMVKDLEQPLQWDEDSKCTCAECRFQGTVREFLQKSVEKPQKQLYFVGIREVHVRHFNVMASSPEDAKDRVVRCAPEAVDLEFLEYSHELEKDTWDAYPISDDSTP